MVGFWNKEMDESRKEVLKKTLLQNTRAPLFFFYFERNSLRIMKNIFVERFFLYYENTMQLYTTLI